MEMLGNIWNALSTENMEFINFIANPLIILESYLVLLLSINLLHIKSNAKQKSLYVLIVSVGRNN